MNSRSMRWTPEQLADFQRRTDVKIKPHEDKAIPKAVKAQLSKYKAVKTEFNGRTYASRKEANRAKELRLMQKAGEISCLEEQPKYELTVNGQLISTYYADFSYADKGGHLVVEDVKGMRSGAAYQLFRLKAKLIKAIYGIEIVEI